MDMLKLDRNYSFAVELLGKKIRLVVYSGGLENVCRLATAKDLEMFMESDESHLFKGRLQLYKTIAGIEVYIKGKPAGTLIAADLMQQLKKQNNANNTYIYC